MDISQQGADQRQQQVTRLRRTKAEWELVALQCQLLYPDYAAFVRDSLWQNLLNFHNHAATQRVMDVLKVWGTCEASTFVSAVRGALIKMKREARAAHRANQREK